MKIRLLSSLVLVLAPLACASSSSGAGASGDAGGLGQDATPTQDAPTATGDADPPPDAPNDAPTDAAAPPVCVSDAGDPSPGDFANVPACTPGSCVFGGTLAGAPLSQTYPVGIFTFSSGDSFSADFGTGGHVYMGSGVLLSGQAESTRGTILMPSEGPLAGKTLCLGDGTELQYVADDAGQVQIRFIARCMTDTCDPSAAPVAGEIEACCEK